MSRHALSFEEVWKSYPQVDGRQLHALRGVTARVEPGARIAIIGRSGSGKSTFLHLAAGIDEPSRGEVSILGSRLSELSDHQRTLQRRNKIGLVFQFFHLLPHLDVLDNVVLPALIAGDRRRDYEPRGRELLDRVGLGDRSSETVEKLSGGEMQRVAICRAMLRRPSLLLADEPTGNLDDETGRRVMELLLRLVEDEASTLIYVTHSLQLAALADQTWSLHSGALEQTCSGTS
jgi:predicted ABC-type transport system involved in lysophospholipase L1 biosynthesis ATPase subunit